MKTITITVDDDKTDALVKHLQSLKEVDYIEIQNDDASPVEIQILEERWESYKKSPSSAKSSDEVKKRIKDEFGLGVFPAARSRRGVHGGNQMV